MSDREDADELRALRAVEREVRSRWVVDELHYADRRYDDRTPRSHFLMRDLLEAVDASRKSSESGAKEAGSAAPSDSAAAWVPFDPRLGSGQRLPEERRFCLAYVAPERPGDAPCIAVGYMRYGAGDRESPFFVVPGHGGDVQAWCPLDEETPLWSEAKGSEREPLDLTVGGWVRRKRD